MIYACKPNSVSRNKSGGSYLSRHGITAVIQRSTRRRQGEQPCLKEKSHRNLLLDLAPSVVYPASDVTTAAVGSYPAFSPLSGNCQTVSFLWHFPCSNKGTPGVTRHFVLRSSDFPLFKEILLK